MPTTADIQYVLNLTFPLVFIAFAGGAFFFYMEKDRVSEEFRAAMRLSTVYLAIAAVNYFYMQDIYRDAVSSGSGQFPTQFRYIDWILTTTLMLIKFPLVIGIGDKGKKFMIRLIILDLVMILGGLVGELNPQTPAVHYGFFMIGAIAWFAIIALLFNALQQLPQDLPQSVQSGVRTMSFFVILGWAIYPAGYMAPLMEVPPEVRELVYNIGDLANKLGLTLVVYATAKRALWEEEEAMEEEQMAIAPNPVPAEAYGQPGYAQAGFAQPSGYSTMLPQGGE